MHFAHRVAFFPLHTHEVHIQDSTGPSSKALIAASAGVRGPLQRERGKGKSYGPKLEGDSLLCKMAEEASLQNGFHSQ